MRIPSLWRITFAVFALGPSVCAAATKPARTNVLVVLADDAGWGDFSFVGNSSVATPAVDSLARDGAVLSQFCVQPVCSPTRAEFLTGRYHPRSGVRGVSLGQERMAPDERTLANVFHDAGYSTGCFGKWHNGTQWPYHPRARGFDTFYGFTEGHWGNYFDAEMEHDGAFVRGRGYIADDITDHAIGFIEAARTNDRPFLCYVAFNTPHSPMSVPEAEWERFHDKPIGQRGPEGGREDTAFTRAALAMVENLDANVGRLLATLERLDVARDTIVIFFSDHGPNSSRWCGGMRGRKGSTDDGGVRSVCCVRYPARIASGTVVDDVTGAIDLVPTLAGLAGVVLTNKKPLDGVDLSPLLCVGREGPATAAALADRAIVASFAGKVSLRTTRHRLDAEGRLYDLEMDPGQTRDIAPEALEEAARLREMAAAWRRDVLDEVQKPAEERFPVGYPGAPLTELPARDGLPHGGVARSGAAPNSSYFTHWTSPDDAITWTVEVLKPGRYSAELWYTCPSADTGATVVLSGGGGTVTGTIHPGWDPPLNTGDDRIARGHGESFSKDFKPLPLGTITLGKGPTTLVLRATTIPGGSAADVRRLVLRPAQSP
jgi:arylsulfatase A-like enzyme